MKTVVRLFYDNEVRDIDYVHLEYYQEINYITGKPCAELEGGYIHLVFTPRGDEDYFLKYWMFANREDVEDLKYPYWLYKIKNGEVVFYEEDYDGRILFKYRFEDCVPIFYRETFHHQYGMMNYIVLSAAIQYYKTKDPDPWLKQWNETWKPPVELKPMVKEEDKTPKVIDFFITNKDGEKIKKAKVGDTIFLNIETKNFVGHTVTIDLDNPEIDYMLNGKRLKDDVVKDYQIKNNTEKIRLEVVEQQKEEK